MKHPFFFLLLCITLGCTTKKLTVEPPPHLKYEIVNSQNLLEGDTIYAYELRCYDTRSALDAAYMMYQNHGHWTASFEGKYQENIDQYVWKNAQLVEGSNECFIVIADGTETEYQYFTSLMVFDSAENNCLAEDHPLKDKITQSLVKKLNEIERKSSLYKVFKD